MSIPSRFVTRMSLLVLTAITCLSGCATVAKEQGALPVGTLQSVENHIRTTIAQVESTDNSLNELIKPEQVDLLKAYTRFAADVDKIDALAMPMDHHSNKINSMGRNYFAEWRRAEQATSAGEQQRTDASELFDRIPQANAGLGSALHAYMSYILETQMYLSRNLTKKGIETITPVAHKALRGGDEFTAALNRVLSTMERVDIQQPFSSACATKAPATFCRDLEKSLFTGTLPVQKFVPGDFLVSDFPADIKTAFVKTYEAKYAAASGYCFLASKGRLDQKKRSPVSFAKVVNGFVILGSDLPAYDAWLTTEDGAKCRQHVENSLGIALLDLHELVKDKFALVILNPLGILGKASVDLDEVSVKNEIKTILNHERIHLLHNSCPPLDDFAKRTLATYDPLKIAALKKQFPLYSWDNPQVELREFLAFTYENDPAPLLDIATACTQ